MTMSKVKTLKYTETTNKDVNGYTASLLFFYLDRYIYCKLSSVNINRCPPNQELGVQLPTDAHLSCLPKNILLVS